MTSLIGCCTELLLGRNEHCTTAAFIVLGLVTYLGVICCTSKQVPSPSSHPLTPNPFFRKNFMVKQVALVAFGTWALMFLVTVLYRWILFAFTFVCHYFRYV